MYESPITIIQDAMSRQIQMDMENNIMKAVMNYNVDVDKEELLKALKYDREQYQKGYEDGKRELAEMLVERFEEDIAENPEASLGEYRAGLYQAIEIVKAVINK